MSADELVVTIAAVVFGPLLWLSRFALWRKLPGAKGALGALGAVLSTCAVILFGVLKTLAASDVRDAAEYLFLFGVLGLAWIRIADAAFPFAGVSVRDDVVERRNGAAMPAAAGAMVGVTLCYAGGNVGEGPGWWVVVFAAALATAMLFACWLLLARLAPVNDAVTIDRDPAAGVRLGAFLIACGLVAGRAVAGDWESAGQTVWDAGAALPVLVGLLLVAVAIERSARPTEERPRAPFVPLGIAPAMAYLAIAGAGVAWLGWPA